MEMVRTGWSVIRKVVCIVYNGIGFLFFWCRKERQAAVSGRVTRET